MSSLPDSLCRATSTRRGKEGPSVHCVSVLLLSLDFRVKPDCGCVLILTPLSCSLTGWHIITKQSSSDAHRSEAATVRRMKMTRWRTLNGVLQQNSRVCRLTLESTDLTRTWKQFHSPPPLKKNFYLMGHFVHFFLADAKFCLKMLVSLHQR